MIPELLDRSDLKDPKATRGRQAHKVLLDRKDLKVTQARLERPDLKDPRATRGRQVHKVLPGRRDLKATQARLDQLGAQDQRELPDRLRSRLCRQPVRVMIWQLVMVCQLTLPAAISLKYQG